MTCTNAGGDQFDGRDRYRLRFDGNRQAGAL